MNTVEAKNMLQAASFGPSPKLWLDLGCGSGVFTLALAELLPSGSQVIGIDKSFQYLPKSSANGVRISFVQADFSYAFKMERTTAMQQIPGSLIRSNMPNWNICL